MASEAPDPKSLRSWEDAFSYPIPVVRRMEQQLRSDLLANQEKLRTLVGASYRDLLGTAERIIEMDGQMELVEANLGEIGRKCNSRILERNGINYERWRVGKRVQDRQRYALGSQLAILHSCSPVISRILRKGRSSLLAAKILVISRLLHKTLDQSRDAPSLLESIRNRLASLRRKLLAQIDRQLSNPSCDIPTILEAMSAFSLATSSTPTDVLRHFHSVRLDAVTAQLRRGDDSQSNITEALRLYVQTLQDTHATFPRKISESLARLKEQPLMKDLDIRAIEELNLDIHEKWVAENVRNFTPWLRHDDLQKSVTEKFLREWAETAFKRVVTGSKTILSTVSDFDAILQLRREVFKVWLSSRSKAAKILSSNGLESLRTMFNTRIIEIFHERVAKFKLVGTKVSSAIADVSLNNTSTSLWDGLMTSMDINEGALSFRKAILDRTHGRNDAIVGIIEAYETCRQSVLQSEALINNLREARWLDDLDDYGDDDLDLDSKYPELTEDDPRALEEQLNQYVTEELDALENEMRDLAHSVTVARNGQQAIFLLRVLRELERRLPSNPSRKYFALSAIPDLHATVAEAISTQPLSRFERSTRRRERSRTVPARALWEGTPQLPVQPSPAVFRLLYGLVCSMAETGGDIWSATATRYVKTLVKQKLFECLDTRLDSRSKPEPVNGHSSIVGDESSHDDEKITNGTSPPEDQETLTPDPSLSRDSKIQKVFDLLFLQKALAAPSTDNKIDGLGVLERFLVDELKLDLQLHERLRKSSQDYWTRTYLLFGLLI